MVTIDHQKDEAILQNNHEHTSAITEYISQVLGSYAYVSATTAHKAEVTTPVQQQVPCEDTVNTPHATRNASCSLDHSCDVHKYKQTTYSYTYHGCSISNE